MVYLILRCVSYLQVLKATHNDNDAEMSDLLWALGKPLSRGNSRPDVRRNVNPKYRVNELHEPPPRLPGIRSLLPLPGGDLLTGGTDLKIRRWDNNRFLFCFVLAFNYLFIFVLVYIKLL